MHDIVLIDDDTGDVPDLIDQVEACFNTHHRYGCSHGVGDLCIDTNGGDAFDSLHRITSPGVDGRISNSNYRHVFGELSMAGAPIAQKQADRYQLFADVRQLILYPHRYFGKHCTPDNPVVFQFP